MIHVEAEWSPEWGVEVSIRMVCSCGASRALSTPQAVLATNQDWVAEAEAFREAHKECST